MRHRFIPSLPARRLALALLLALLAPVALDAQAPQWRRMALDTLQASGEVYTGIVRTVNVDSAGSIYVTTPSDTIQYADRFMSRSTLWRSDDDGATWTRLRDDVLGADLVTPYPGFIYAMTVQRHPVFVIVLPIEISTDHGLTWTVMVPDYFPGAFAWNASGVVVLGTIENKGGVNDLAVSADSGRTWTRRKLGYSYLPLYGAVTPGGTIVVNGHAPKGATAHERSTDAGRTWSSVDSVPMTEVVAAMPNGTLIAWGFGIPGSGKQPKHIYRSTDDGLTWTMSADSVGYISSFHHAGDRAVLASEYRSLMRSTDDGVTWSRPNEGDSTLDDLFAFMLDRAGAVVALDSHARSGSGVLRSTDAGATWSPIGAGIAVGEGGRYLSHAVTPSGAHLVATTSGLWRDDAASSVDLERLPMALRTISVAPHPVRGTASIALALDRATTVTIVLHDLLGRVVRTVHTGRLGAGERSVRFDAEGLAPGAYVLRATIDGAVTARTIVVR